MFFGEQCGMAEKAFKFYTSVFHDSKIDGVDRYVKGQEPDKPGTVIHASFTLENQQFAAMDSAQMHDFSFNEAISLMVQCETQKEIDYYWEKLLEGGGEEGVCGWLKDMFGFSWQVSPAILAEMLRDPDKKKVERVTSAFLKMKKFDIEELKKAFRG
jgi:predicted 3-demethylubiquinone-9 3-methyltransferase (glyoxalase superfamily)